MLGDRRGLSQPWPPYQAWHSVQIPHNETPRQMHSKMLEAILFIPNWHVCPHAAHFLEGLRITSIRVCLILQFQVDLSKESY